MPPPPDPLDPAASLPGLDDAGVQAQVDAARVRAVHDAAPKPLVASLGFTALAMALLYGHAPIALLVGWVAWRVVWTMVRLASIAAYRRDPDAARRSRHWSRVFIGLMAPDALNWAALPILFMPYVEAQGDLMLFASAVGVTAVGAFTTWHHRGAGIAFIALVTLPVSIDQLLFHDRIGLYCGLSLWLYFGLLVNEVIRAQVQLDETMRLRFGYARLADQRRQALDLAEASSVAKTRFLAAVSHEIRTPLNGVVGMAHLLRDTADPAQRAHRLEVLNHSAQHLQTIVDDLIDMARLDVGRLELHNEPVAPATLVRDVTDLLRPDAQAKRLALELQLAPDLPAWVMVDAGRVRQVLFNLVGNAVKFTRQGRIVVTLAPTVEGLRLQVIDTGDGIPADSLERVFDAFEQAGPGAAARRAGAGLGLTISRQLARAMGGDVRCSSIVGVGTTFEFDLAAPPCPAPPEPTTPAVVDSRWRGRVLVADDNPVNALVAEGMLERLGLDVEVANDGAQALALLAAQPFDAVLMDCLMPGIDGYEATRRWRVEEQRQGLPPTPIVALTANAVAGDRDTCLAAGMSDYIAKPFSLEQLVEVLARHLPGLRRVDERAGRRDRSI
ncbi:ATP-binding protein [Ideonella sp. A 288]|uniref:ATP-binding protein n=1 Tax=Ideonella sp. A 288 TaxID=1962181 RepID=UPI001303DA77|nr:ATP-binding protein [Ideonella sp. A 288]